MVQFFYLIMIIRELFAIPVFQEKIDNYDLKDYVIDLSNNDTTVIKSNVGGWQSKQYYKPEKQFESLWNKINLSLNTYHKSLQLKGTPYISDWWFNVNGKGHSNSPHLHGASTHSGTFYINTPENCGDIHFSHPCIGVAWAYPNYMIEKENTENSLSWWFPAKKDWLYIFPSYVTHWVTANESDEPRISVAFNTKVKI